MTLIQLRDRVSEIIQDNSFDDTYIDAALNRALIEVTGKMTLPTLVVSATVTISANGTITAMPTDFYHDLIWGWNVSTSSSLTIEMNRNRLQERFSDGFTGSEITHIAQDNFQLYNWPMVAEDTDVALRYYSEPAAVSSADATISCLPELYQDVLVYHVVAMVYEMIEDGVEGQKVNTQFYTQKYNMRLEELKNFYRFAVKQPTTVKRRQFGI